MVVRDLAAERRATMAPRPPEPTKRASLPRSHLSSEETAILALQRTLGNQAVVAMLGHDADPAAKPMIQRWYTAKKPLPQSDGTERAGRSRKQSLNPLTMFGLGFFHRQIFFDTATSRSAWATYTDMDAGTGLWGVMGVSEDTHREAKDYTKDGVQGRDDERMRQAVFQLQQSGEWDKYNLVTHNCQHFVKAALKKRGELEQNERESEE